MRKRINRITFRLILTLSPVFCHAQDNNALNLHWSRLLPPQTVAEHINTTGVEGAFAGISGDALIVAGGVILSDAKNEFDKKIIDDIFVLDLNNSPDSLKWMQRNNLDRAVAYGAAVSTPYGILCMGGKDAKQILDAVFLLKWDQHAKKLSRINLPSLPQPCVYGNATVLEDQVYLAGGQSGTDLQSAMKNFWRLDLSPLANNNIKALTWEELAPWPGPERACNITVAQHNGQTACVYVLSGRRMSEQSLTQEYEILTDVYEFNPAVHNSAPENAWRQRQDTPMNIARGTATALGQSHILLLASPVDLSYSTGTQDENYQRLPNKTWLFHTITNTWIVSGSAPVGHFATGIMNWHDKFILPATDSDQQDQTTDVWLIRPEPESIEFGVLNFSVLILYLLSMMLIGFYFAKRNKDTNDYFRGGQHIPWWAAACSIFATMLSSITYMSVPARAYA
ncbi:MAG: sodium:solute symporter, partial [Calditrichaeota bacterium]